MSNNHISEQWITENVTTEDSLSLLFETCAKGRDEWGAKTDWRRLFDDVRSNSELWDFLKLDTLSVRSIGSPEGDHRKMIWWQDYDPDKNRRSTLSLDEVQKQTGLDFELITSKKGYVIPDLKTAFVIGVSSQEYKTVLGITRALIKKHYFENKLEAESLAANHFLKRCP